MFYKLNGFWPFAYVHPRVYKKLYSNHTTDGLGFILAFELIARHHTKLVNMSLNESVIEYLDR
jgi:hypothetical protein